MKRLTMLRHAKSSWDDASLDDFHRPLNGRGRRNAPEMGRRLHEHGQKPDLLISSPATRAITTARTVAREMELEESRIIEDRALYHAAAGDILAIVRSLETLSGHLMLVGHNPGFTDFANRISSVRIDNIPTAGLFCVDLDIGDWSECDIGAGRFVYFDFPKNDRRRPLTADDF